MSSKQHIPVITIDGPSGTGKGTICHKVAHHLGWHYLDSGAIYRVLAWVAHTNHVDPTDVERLTQLAQELCLSFSIDENMNSHCFVDDQDITRSIRTETCGQLASKIAVIPEVRTALLDKQRAFAEYPGLVTDGRDMGTIVFPHADLKIFLYASLEERAQRRLLQLQNHIHHDTIDQVIAQLTERDARDSSRLHAPLMSAENAIQIDTTSLSIQQVFTKVVELIVEKGLA